MIRITLSKKILKKELAKIYGIIFALYFMGWLSYNGLRNVWAGQFFEFTALILGGFLSTIICLFGKRGINIIFPLITIIILSVFWGYRMIVAFQIDYAEVVIAFLVTNVILPAAFSLWTLIMTSGDDQKWIPLLIPVAMIIPWWSTNGIYFFFKLF